MPLPPPERPAEQASVQVVSRSPLGVQPETSNDLNFTMVSELLAEPDERVSWIVDGLLPSGGLSLLAGKPKAGKSTLARCLALSVARGLPVIGRDTVAGPVIYVALEDKRSEVKKHLREMGAGREPLMFHVGPLVLDADEAVGQVQSLAGSLGAVLIVIDTLLRFIHVRNANDYAEMTNALNPLLVLARTTGAHLMLVHHAGKKNRADLDAILGSVAFAGSVDTGLVLRREGQSRTLESQQRYGDDLPATPIGLDPKTRRIEVGNSTDMLFQSGIQDQILKALAGGPLTEDDIRGMVGGDTGRVGKVLRLLVAYERVVRAGSGTRGAPFHYSLAVCPL